MQKVAARSDLLQSKQVPALVVNAGEAVARELLRDIGLSRAVTLLRLCSSKYPAIANRVEDKPRPVRHPAIEVAVTVAIVGSRRRVLDVLGHAGEFKSLAVVIGGVAAAMAHRHRVVARHLIKIVDFESAVALHLGVVEEIALDPGAGRGFAGADAQLLDNAFDGDEFHIVGIADEYFVKEDRTRRMVVRVDEPRDDRHLMSNVGLGPSAGEPFNLFARSYCHETPGLYGKGFRPRHQRVDGVDFCVEDDEIGVGTLGRDGRRAEPWRTCENRRTAGNKAHELTTTLVSLHRTSPAFSFRKRLAAL